MPIIRFKQYSGALEGQPDGWLFESPLNLALVIIVVILLVKLAVKIIPVFKNRRKKTKDKQKTPHTLDEIKTEKPQNSKEKIKCDSCGAVYYSNEHTRCPYCNN